MNNRRPAIFILAILGMLLVPGAALYDVFTRTTRLPHERILPLVRILAAVPHLPEGTGPASRRRFFRAVLDAAEPWDIPFIWEDASGTLAVGPLRPLDAAECFSRLENSRREARVPGWVCGQGRQGRWALGAAGFPSGGLPWDWRWLSWAPLLGAAWMAGDILRRRREEARLAATARSLARGEPVPSVAEAPAAEALAVMAAAIREREERLAAQLQTIEAQNREILQSREKFITQEKLVTLGHLAAGLAHELGNPLSSLMAHIEWLSETESDPGRRQHLDMMKGETRRMDELLRRLLLLARGSAFGEDPVRVGESITQAVEILRHQKWCANVDFRLELASGDADALVTADIRTILLNLLLNAAQAMKGSGSIRIVSARQDGCVLVRVTDTGPGVPESLAQAIFEPFFTTKDPGEGTGLGLSVSRMLAQRAGGELSCIPGGDGGHFLLELPVIPEKTDAPSEERS